MLVCCCSPEFPFSDYSHSNGCMSFFLWVCKVEKIFILKFKLFNSKTLFSRESNSPELHSESEFYCPDKIDKNVNTGNTDKQKSKKRATNSNKFWLKCMILLKRKGLLKTPRKNSLWHKCMEMISYLGWWREKYWRHTCKWPEPSHFFMKIKKTDGKQYKPTTLLSFHQSLQG